MVWSTAHAAGLCVRAVAGTHALSNRTAAAVVVPSLPV